MYVFFKPFHYPKIGIKKFPQKDTKPVTKGVHFKETRINIKKARTCENKITYVGVFWEHEKLHKM